MMIILFVTGIVVVSNAKQKRNKKSSLKAPAQVYKDERGKYSIVFPGSHGKPKGDTSLIQTRFGQTDFYAYSTSGSNSAAMIAYYDIDKKDIFNADSNLAANARVFLDTLQNQLIQNLNGKAGRRVKVVKDGLYHSRTTYFTAKGEKDSIVYFRCENVYNPPRIYQLIFQSAKKSSLESAEAKKFFQSFSIVKSK